MHKYVPSSLSLLLSLCVPSAAAGITFFDPVNGAPPPTLTELGIYTDIVAKDVDPAMKYFEVNAALWSDGAAKHRWVVLPNATSIAYNDTTDAFDYPQGAMFVKNFYLDSVEGDASTRRYWETRILVNKHDEAGFDEWHGFTYKWNKAQTEAFLVSTLNGLDTVFYYHPKGLSKPQTYKKWSFPSQYNCIKCHKQPESRGLGDLPARGVLGFFPAQLKRQAPKQPSINQVNWLFDQGVFIGDRPNEERLKHRWKGLSEPIPAHLVDVERFKVVDSMARSYIAANCSGCHSDRNAGLSDSHSSLIYDWHTLTPRIEFGALQMNTLGIGIPEDLSGPLPDLDNSEGRRKFVAAVERSGMAGNRYWTMTLPAQQLDLTIITPGFPAASVLLYRQFAKRRPAWRDSLSMRFKLDYVDSTQMKAWIFTHPWGSQAWRADMAAHGIKVDSLLNANGWSQPDGHNPMPLLATNLPDTAAMAILGEWVGNYRTLVPVEGYPIISRVNGRPVASRAEMPLLRNRVLVVPQGWSGKAQMFSLSGRAYALPSAGRGRYVVPLSVPAGVYTFRVGNRSFRASLW